MLMEWKKGVKLKKGILKSDNKTIPYTRNSRISHKTRINSSRNSRL